MNRPSRHTSGAVAARIRKRYAAERNFRLLGLGAVLFSALVLAFLPVTGELASAMRSGGSSALARAAALHRTDGTLVWAWDPGFLSRSDATDPQAAGIWAALKGSMLTMLVTLVLAFPVGVLAAVYL